MISVIIKDEKVIPNLPAFIAELESKLRIKFANTSPVGKISGVVNIIKENFEDSVEVAIYQKFEESDKIVSCDCTLNDLSMWVYHAASIL